MELCYQPVNTVRDIPTAASAVGALEHGAEQDVHARQRVLEPRAAETAQRARLASTPRYRCSTSGDARSSPGVAVTLISPFSIT
jgi:hypothetical protein